MSLYIARGSEISFEISFLDINRQLMAPSTATLWVSYKEEGERVAESIEMNSEGEGIFTATWDSSIADPGTIEWHVRADGGAAEDGSFQLVANNANLLSSGNDR